LHQVPSEPVGGGVCQKDDALGEPVAGPVHVGLLDGRFVRRVQLGLVRVHKQPLFAQACDGADVVQRLTGNLQIKDTRYINGTVRAPQKREIAEKKLFQISVPPLGNLCDIC